ncbi:MAG: 23S rRNA (pseudouridine(1915)-N(3))-methyltransferase RlmH [Bacteroidales bacterium]|nr:23S rRNA (pseudouridine(1915)-N(3))-methyltransferase RlmH [Bacteroidales bacterium]
MKISLYYIGKKDHDNKMRAYSIFEKRIRHYVPFEIQALGKPRLTGKQSADRHREEEGKIIMKALTSSDQAVLLDVNGRQMNSEDFSGFIQQSMNRGIRHLVFIIGGSYGTSDAVYNAVPEKISLSLMTFSHELSRLVFLEQLYRAMTILNGEPYHHIK